MAVLVPLAVASLALTFSPAADKQISQLMMKHDPILHWARRLLPPPRAAAASALYTWCRQLDEITDEPGASPDVTRARLDEWESNFDALVRGEPVDELDGALLATMRAHPTLGRAPFDAMLQGMRDDTAAEGVRYETWRPELLTYCYRVAGSVGEMLLPVLGLDEGANEAPQGAVAKEVRQGALALGCAVQLLNILRDLRSDLVTRGRIYLPLADARRCGLSPSQLEDAIRSSTQSPQLRRLIRMQHRRAGALLAMSEAALPTMTAWQALVVGVIVALHRELHAEIKRCDYDTLTGAAGAAEVAAGEPARVRVSSGRKMTLTMSTAASILTNGPAGHYAAIRRDRSRAGSTIMSASRADEPRAMAGDEAALPSWEQLGALVPSATIAPPKCTDSVRATKAPDFPTDRPTLFRERHGWCPYSERVWLALELKGIDYESVRIDNTGGGRPSYFSGSTPQMRWADGRTQGESMDLVKALDQAYPDSPPLWPPVGVDRSAVDAMVGAWRNTFPRSARPSSRAAFLFGYDGDALPLSSFTATLEATEELLGKHPEGPFFCGSAVSAADVAWAPFLERYAAQLPCLHANLAPRDADGDYPRLAAWFDAMETLPAYACRVEGDAASWRKVLSMAGYGNSGVPARVLARMDEAAAIEAFGGLSTTDPAVWSQYAAGRPHVASSPGAEAAATILRNRNDLLDDASKRRMELDADALDEAFRALAYLLIARGEAVEDALVLLCRSTRGVGEVAAYADQRMCVPRDMGAPPAAQVKLLAAELAAPKAE